MASRWYPVDSVPLPSLDLLGRTGAVVMLAVAGFGAWSDRPALVFIALAIVAVMLAAAAWERWALARITCQFELAEDRAFPGESLRVGLRVENRKPLPLSWLRARAAIPPGLTPPPPADRWRLGNRAGYLEGFSALGPFGEARWEFEVGCRARGVYQVGPVELYSGDLFGLVACREILRLTREIVVYPRIVPLRHLGLSFAEGVGGSTRARALLEDPSRPAGLRPYQPGDPPARVDWKATARTGTLHVTVLEPAAAQRIILLLAAETFDYPWDNYRAEIFELAVTALASIAWWACRQGWQVGLLTNGVQPASLPAAASPIQLNVILETLARQQPAKVPPIDLLDPRHGRTLQAATYLCAAGRGTDDLQAMLLRLRRAGHRIGLLYSGPDGTAPELPGVRLYQLRKWDDLGQTLASGGRPAAGRDSR